MDREADGAPRDREGNPPAPVFSTDEGPIDDESGERAPVHCGTCGAECREAGDNYYAALAMREAEHVEYYEPAAGGSYEILQCRADDAPTAEFAGFYWWACFPGCLPDGDGIPNGPFETVEAAREDVDGDAF